MAVHCLFEQSGVFKNEFKKLGIEAYDYDILNDFGETDFKLDLFREINIAYDGCHSIFDDFNRDDLIFAFFPCTRFENQSELLFRGSMSSLKTWSLERKLEYDLNLHVELSELYSLITKLVLVCIRNDFKLIIENPYSSTHYLVKYWAYPASIIDYDRSRSGDRFVKPTQFWFLNCSPNTNFVSEPISYNKLSYDINHCHSKVERSLIHPDYARRFILTYIL